MTGIKNISQGNLTTEIPVYRTDEFGRLAQSINSMVEKLKKEIAYSNLLLYDTQITDQPEDKDKMKAQKKKGPGNVKVEYKLCVL